MPLLTLDKVLRIISTILNVLLAALRAFNIDFSNDSDEENESEKGHS